jgi:hypothetical protein
VLYSLLLLFLWYELKFGGKFIFQAIEILKITVVLLPVGGVLDQTGWSRSRAGTLTHHSCCCTAATLCNNNN